MNEEMVKAAIQFDFRRMPWNFGMEQLLEVSKEDLEIFKTGLELGDFSSFPID